MLKTQVRLSGVSQVSATSERISHSGAGVLPEVVGEFVEGDAAVLGEAVVHVAGGIDGAVVAGAVPGEADQRELGGGGALKDAALLDGVALAVNLGVVGRGDSGLLLLVLLLRLLSGSFLLLLLHRLLFRRGRRLLLGVVVIIVVAAADQRETGRADACAGAGPEHRAPRDSAAAHPRPIVGLHRVVLLCSLARELIGHTYADGPICPSSA